MPSSSVCYVCGKSGASDRLQSREQDRGKPFFPFIATQDSPKGAKPLSSEGVVLGCKMCVSFLLNQWADFERRNVSLDSRSYFVKNKSLVLGGASAFKPALNPDPVPATKSGNSSGGELKLTLSSALNAAISLPDQQPEQAATNSCYNCRCGLNTLNTMTILTRPSTTPGRLYCPPDILGAIFRRPVSASDLSIDVCSSCGMLVRSRMKPCSDLKDVAVSEPEKAMSSPLASLMFEGRPGYVTERNPEASVNEVSSTSGSCPGPSCSASVATSIALPIFSKLAAESAKKKLSPVVTSVPVPETTAMAGSLSHLAESEMQYRASPSVSGEEGGRAEEEDLGSPANDGTALGEMPHNQLPVKKKWRSYTFVSSDAENSTEDQLKPLLPSPAFTPRPVSSQASPQDSSASASSSSVMTVVSLTDSGVFRSRVRRYPVGERAGGVLVLTEVQNPGEVSPAPEDATQEAPVVCFICGAFEFRPGVLFTKPADRGLEVSGIRSPFFPFLNETPVAKGAANIMEDGSVTVCQICYHILIAQWNECEASSDPLHMDRWRRIYDSCRLPCCVCSSVFRRKRAAILRVADFPFLKYHTKPPGAVALRRGRECVVCRSCSASLCAQLHQYVTMGMPPHFRQYNWNSRRERNAIQSSDSEDNDASDNDLHESAVDETPLSRHVLVRPVGVARVVRKRKRPRNPPPESRDPSDDETQQPAVNRKRAKRPAPVAVREPTEGGAGVDSSSCYGGCPGDDSDSMRDDTDASRVTLRRQLQRTPRRRRPRLSRKSWLGPNPLAWGEGHREAMACASHSEEDAAAAMGLSCLAEAATVHSRRTSTEGVVQQSQSFSARLAELLPPTATPLATPSSAPTLRAPSPREDPPSVDMGHVDTN